MTEQIKSAIEEFNEIVEDIDERGEAPCYFGEDDLWYLKLAIRSLQAWEEVLNELEYLKDRTPSPTMFLAYLDTIDIIKQKLAEIKE